MLLTLMYHQVFDQTNTKLFNAFAKHLETIATRYPILLPGEPVPKNKLGLCLTFDDAYADFYFKVYPLLKKLRIRAILGVVTNLTPQSASLPAETRLSIPYPEGLSTHGIQNQALCSWEEIKEMSDSGFVVPASHTHNHEDATCLDFDVATEFKLSRDILREKTGLKTNILIYPYGKFSKKIQKTAQAFYQYTFRIGSAINLSSHGQDGLLYRIDADNIWPKRIKPSGFDYIKAYTKYWLNVIRKK